MKKLYKMLIIIVILCAFSLPAAANEADKYIDDFIEILPDDFGELAEKPTDVGSLIGLENLLSEVFSALSARRGEMCVFFLVTLGSAIVLSLVSLTDSPALGVTRSGVGIAVSAAIGASLLPVFSELSRSLSEASAFFGALLPVTTAISAASGAAASASVGAVGMGLSLSLIGGFGGAAMTSLSGFSLSLAMLSPIGLRSAGSLFKSVRSLFLWVLGIVTTLLLGTLSLQSVLASAQDSAAMRGVKYLASGMIPVVGSTVSGALSTLASGMSYVKSVVGIGAVWVLLLTLLPPLIMLLLYRFALTLAVSVTEGLGAESEPFSSLRFSLDSLTAVYSLSGVIYVFEIVLFIKSGVNSL